MMPVGEYLLTGLIIMQEFMELFAWQLHHNTLPLIALIVAKKSEKHLAPEHINAFVVWC